MTGVTREYLQLISNHLQAVHSSCSFENAIKNNQYWTCITGQHPAILHQKSSNLATATVCYGYSCTLKRGTVSPFSSFTKSYYHK